MQKSVFRAASIFVLALPLMAFECSGGGGDEDGDKSPRQACIDRIKRDYPVPPGNINEQNQMIQMECGGL